MIETKQDSAVGRPPIHYGIDLDTTTPPSAVATPKLVPTPEQVNGPSTAAAPPPTKQAPTRPGSAAGSATGSTGSVTDREVRQIIESSAQKSKRETESEVAPSPKPKSTSCTQYSVFKLKDIMHKKPALVGPDSNRRPKQVGVLLLENLEEFYVQLVDKQAEFFAEQDQKIKELCGTLKKKSSRRNFYLNFFYVVEF